MAAKQVHIYGRDADDTLEWIQEKEGVVSSDDFGHDLESAQALVSKHEVLEVSVFFNMYIMFFSDELSSKLNGFKICS